jgi:hypothetical protein
MPLVSGEARFSHKELEGGSIPSRGTIFLLTNDKGQRMLDDSILEHPIFDKEMESEEDFINTETYLADAGIFYPEKVEFEPIKETVYICYDPYEELFYLKDRNVNSTSLSEIYDEIDKQDVIVKFDESIKMSDWVDEKSFLSGMLFTKAGSRPGFNRILIEGDQSHALEYNTYFRFLKNAKWWLANQDDFVMAYYFTKNHPAFWYRPAFEKHPFMWETEYGHHGLSLYVSRGTIGIEHGQSVPPTHSHHYHDTRLDVYAPTFEEAHIAFAKKVHQYFYLDGTERPEDCTSEEK